MATAAAAPAAAKGPKEFTFSWEGKDKGGKTVRGEIRAEELWGLEEGSRVKLSTGEHFLILRPTYADLIPHLPRAAQVIYPKDTGPMLIWGDVYPGATVIEGGIGAGAFTIALLRRYARIRSSIS